MGTKKDKTAETVEAPHQTGILVVNDQEFGGGGMTTAVSCQKRGREAASTALLAAIDKGEIAGAQMRAVGDYIQFTALPGREQDLRQVITLVTNAVTEYLMANGVNLKKEHPVRLVFPVPTVYLPAGCDGRSTRNEREQVRSWWVEDNEFHYCAVMGRGFDWRYRAVELVIQLYKNGEPVQTHGFLRHFTFSVNEAGEVETQEVRPEEADPFYDPQELAAAIKGNDDDHQKERAACAWWLNHLCDEAWRTARQVLALLDSQRLASTVADRLARQPAKTKTKPAAKAKAHG